MNRFTASCVAVGVGMFLTHVAVAAPLNYEDYPIIKLRSLDKITARTMNFEAKVGSTIRFGDIFIKVQACRKPPPIEKNEAAAFLQIYQADEASQAAQQGAEKDAPKSSWIFSGWMFSSSPAISAMDHPIYDVWLLDCLGRDPEPLPPPEQQAADAEQAETKGETETPAVDGAPSSETAPAASPVEDTDNVNASPASSSTSTTPADSTATPEATTDDQTNSATPTDSAAPTDETPRENSEPSLDEMLQPKKAVTSSSDPVPSRAPQDTTPVEETPLTAPEPQPETQAPSNLDGIY